MRGLGVAETAETTDRLAAVMQLLSGGMSMVTAVSSVVAMCNMASSAMAVAETAPHLSNPIGWSRIAIALGAAAVASVVVGGILSYTMSADMSSPSQAKALAQQIGGVL